MDSRTHRYLARAPTETGSPPAIDLAGGSHAATL